MAQSNIYIDIKEIVIRNFSFLKSYGFKDFEENQLAYELHFVGENDYVSIDVWFEEISSTPIWIKINGYFLDNLELENVILKECERQRSEKTEKVLNKNEQQKSEERIKNMVYTLEYQLFPEGSIDDAYEEFSSLYQLYTFLTKRDEITKYRILDWNMAVIKMM